MARLQRGHSFTALRAEGGILPPEFLQTIAALRASKQKEADYGISKSLVLKDELARNWRIASDHYARYAEQRRRKDIDERTVGINNWLVPLCRTVFGYENLPLTEGGVTVGEQTFKLTHRACEGAIPLLLTTCDFDLDKTHPGFGEEGRRQAPHNVVQEFLNAEDRCLWGVVSNGLKLRILRDNPSLTRPAYIEADLELIFEEELYSDFTALWLIFHASRLKPVGTQPADCIIEDWRKEAHKTGERALEKLRGGVTEALRQLGNGFVQHPNNHALRSAIDKGMLLPEAYFQQLLRLVYRLLFLFAAEERDLLHAPDATDDQRNIYEQGYSLARLRERALRGRHYDRHQDIWQGLKITFRALARGESGLGLPALGGPFLAGQCPDLDGAAIANGFLLDAVRALAFFRSEDALARVNYRDMGTEELGAVYESLLELQPVVEVDVSPWKFRFSGDGSGDEKSRGSERKQTGSYYTPASLVGELIKSALEPVLARVIAEHPEDPRRAILDINVIDPACGSGHFLLAAARRMASEIARIESVEDTSNEEIRRHALREVVQHCIYGVDRNPLAVELCKTALWIEAVEPGKPLTFLDAHIQQGDSLVGILNPEVMSGGIPDEAYKCLPGDEKGSCRNISKRNRRAGLSVQPGLYEGPVDSPSFIISTNLDSMPEETLNDIEHKKETWQRACLDPAYRVEALRANLFTGAFFARKTLETIETVPHTEDIHRLDKEDMQCRPGVEAEVSKLADQYHFFHWHLAFPEIMRRGGFDVVLGNPPWDVSQLSEEEFFVVRAPSIAELPGAKRKKAIAKLEREHPRLWDQYQQALRGYDVTNQFCRVSKRYPLTAHGKLNKYALFAELVLQLLSPKGCSGLIVPTGIATDKSTKLFFDEIVTNKRIVSLYDFENRKKLFSGVHGQYKFCLLTLIGSEILSPKGVFSFYLHQVEQIQEESRCLYMSADDFSFFNPNTKNCPLFRSCRDMEIARKMYQRAGIFWKEPNGEQPDENPWDVKFMTMFNMTSDSGLFRTREELVDAGWLLNGNVFTRGENRYVSLYEAKIFEQYDHRFATFDNVSQGDLRKGNARALHLDEKQDAKVVSIPRYWIEEKELKKRLDIDKKMMDNEPAARSPQPAARSPQPAARSPLYTLEALVRRLLSGRSRVRQTNEQESGR